MQQDVHDGADVKGEWQRPEHSAMCLCQRATVRSLSAHLKSLVFLRTRLKDEPQNLPLTAVFLARHLRNINICVMTSSKKEKRFEGAREVEYGIFDDSGIGQEVVC